MTMGKTVLAALMLAAGLAAFAPLSAQAYDHRGHKVCHFDHHHHRACHWVR